MKCKNGLNKIEETWDHYFGSIQYDNDQGVWEDQVFKAQSWKELIGEFKRRLPKKRAASIFCAGLKFKDGTEEDFTLDAKQEVRWVTTDGINDKIKDMIHNRMDVGQVKYGGEIQIDDSRDMVRETLEECLDGMVYIAAKLVQIQDAK